MNNSLAGQASHLVAQSFGAIGAHECFLWKLHLSFFAFLKRCQPERVSKHSPIFVFGRLSIGTSSDGHYENVTVSRGPWPLILTGRFPTVIIGGGVTHITH